MVSVRFRRHDGAYESHGFGWGERRHVGLRDGKRDLRQFRRIRIADVHFGFIRMELEFEAEQGVESVSRFHDVGHHLQHVVEYGALPLFVAFAAHAGKWRRGQAHESHFAFVAQPFGHAGDEEFHDAVDAVGTVTHEVERPSDHFAVLIGRQPAGDAQHLTVRVHRVQQFDAWIDQLVHTTQGEAHFRQGLLAGPLRGDLTDLRLHGERRFLEDSEEKIKKVGQSMNLSHFEVLSEKSLYKKRKRRDFASQVEEEKQQEELSREDVLRLNKIHTRYQQAEIEDFIEAYMHDDHMEVKDIDIRDEESFEKLILAYDYSTRRNSKYKVIERDDKLIDNGSYRYPALTFVRRKPKS